MPLKIVHDNTHITLYDSVRSDNYVSCHDHYNHDRVEFLCPICRDNVLLKLFYDDKVTNCDGHPINPNVLLICYECGMFFDDGEPWAVDEVMRLSGITHKLDVDAIREALNQ